MPLKLYWVNRNLVDVFWGEGWYNHVRLLRVRNSKPTQWEVVSRGKVPIEVQEEIGRVVK